MLFVKELEFHGKYAAHDEPRWKLPAAPGSISVKYENFGRSPAIIVEKCIEWLVAPELPPQPIYKAIVVAANGDIVDRSANRQHSVGEDRIQFSDEVRLALDSHETNLWAYGFVRYRDYLNGEHCIGFCGRWEKGHADRNSPHRFLEEGPDEYRYKIYNPAKL